MISTFTDPLKIPPGQLLLRLVIASALGWVVAWMYCSTRKRTADFDSLPPTLVLMSILIAMVTQVVGDSVARAFSLVGALSIVRFRTAVRNSHDTAFVLFAVVIGMAVGASHLYLAGIGLLVVGAASYIMMRWGFLAPGDEGDCILSLRVSLGVDLEKLAANILLSHFAEYEAISVGTAKQGASIDAVYKGRLRPNRSASALVKALNQVEGIQSVQFGLRDADED